MGPSTRRARGGPGTASPATRRLARVLAVALRQGRDGELPGEAVAALHAAAECSLEALADARGVCRTLLHMAPADARLRRADRLLAAALHPSAGHGRPAARRVGPPPDEDEEDATMLRPMDPTTRQNLLTALRSEAFEHLTYLLCARQARANGRGELGALFERVAAEERLEHFAAGARLAGVLGSDAENLRDAARAEGDEAGQVYRGFAEQATAAGEPAAAEYFARLGDDERVHGDTFRTAVRDLDPADPAE